MPLHKPANPTPSLVSLLEPFSVIWQGEVNFKQQKSLVQFHLMSDNPAIVHAMTCTPININQKMNLGEQQMDWPPPKTVES